MSSGRSILLVLPLLVVLSSCCVVDKCCKVPCPPMATDKFEYGFSATNPIYLGGLIKGDVTSVGKERLTSYFRMLKTPDGQSVTGKRAEACCVFSTANAPGGKGMLEVWEVSYPAGKKLYFNVYDEGALYIPDGYKEAPKVKKCNCPHNKGK